jgi:membrane protein implicated in regulation of membrane protease activity
MVARFILVLLIGLFAAGAFGSVIYVACLLLSKSGDVCLFGTSAFAVLGAVIALYVFWPFITRKKDPQESTLIDHAD